jgi:SUKH-3 immunity protein
MTSRNTNGDFRAFSPTTMACLRAAGWRPERKTPLEKYRAAFAEERIGFPKKVQEFLSRFGGLVISYTVREKQQDTLDFLADEAVQGLGGKALRLYEKFADSGKLFPIGHFADGACLLMMSVSGKVYGGLDWRILFVGESGSHAIENIISAKDMQIIHDEPPRKAVKQG